MFSAVDWFEVCSQDKTSSKWREDKQTTTVKQEKYKTSLPARYLNTHHFIAWSDVCCTKEE